MAKEPTDRESSKEVGGNFGKMSGDSKFLAAVAMRGADTFQKFIVYACYSIGTIALFVVSMPPYDAGKQLAAGGGAVACIASAMGFVLVRYRNLRDPLVEPAPSQKPRNLDISVLEQNAIRETLENARKVAFNFLHALNSSLLDEQVRANIFFPEYGRSGKWDDYCLKIRPGLHHNMNSDAEIAIVLKPKQGATGQVFDSGVPRVARKLDENSASGWEETHHITPELGKVLNKNLQWIISMPVKRGGEKPIGVMDVDGLFCEFKNDQLQDCMKELTPYPFIIDGFIRR
jgi:hypothetical protein